MKFELVLIPYPAIGHLKSAVEVAKLLVERETRLSISVIIIPFISGGEVGVSDYISALSTASSDRLSYKFILTENQPTAVPTKFNLHIENQLPKVRSAVAKLVDDYSTLPDSPRIAGFVVDMFCTSIIDVANEFGFPSYLFFPSSAGILALGLHVQVLYDENKYDVTETEAELIVPIFTRPYPVKCLPYSLLSNEMLPVFVNLSRRLREMKGILVNTVAELSGGARKSIHRGSFDPCATSLAPPMAELEPYVLKFLLSGDTPPAYSVGPFLHLDNNQVDDSVDEKQSEILRWLDKQPASSVVFLCFGSMGGFSEDQAREIAVSLERSGHGFLWSLRRESPNIDKELPGDFTNLEKVLPEGFFDRTKEIGKVIGWAPQTAVLANPAIGGFVTHCGWNSMLESLWFGVPTAAWPLYAEQKFNAFEMVEELGLAVEIKKYWRGDLLLARTEMETVTAEEIERGIRCLMQHDSDVRKRVQEMREKCHVAFMDGGSSRIALEKFVQDVMENIVLIQ